MARVRADRVYETSTTTGTGAYTLAGAKNTTFRAFSAVCADADTVPYCAFDTANGGWEVGIGTWGTGGILTRTTISASSNANAAVSWAAGTREVFLTDSAANVAPRRLPIFSAEAAAATPVSNGENIALGRAFPTGLASGTTYLSYGNSLIVATTITSDSNVATSPDGETFTLRALTASGQWRAAADGNNHLAKTGTTINISTNGTVWSAATALAGTSAINSYPCGISGTWLVYGSTTTVYRSTNHGTSWSTETLPAAMGPNGGIFKVNGYFWYWNTGATAYYSATGSTGSWTSVTLPITPTAIWVDTDGAIYFVNNGVGMQVYTMTDQDTYAAVTGITTLASATPLYTLNGTRATFSTTYGEAGTYHATGSMMRASSSSQATGQAVTNGTAYVIPSTGGNVITINEADSQTALFE